MTIGTSKIFASEKNPPHWDLKWKPCALLTDSLPFSQTVLYSISRGLEIGYDWGTNDNGTEQFCPACVWC